jgi:hypothetical protein
MLMRRTILIVAMTLCSALLATLAAAHDFWLVPVGEEIEARTGERFPVSETAIDAGRLVVAEAVTAAGRSPLQVIGQRDSALVLRADPTAAGVLYAAVTLAPRQISLSAKDFNNYLREDGLPQIYAERARRGELDRPAVERYRKDAKALIVRPGSGSAALAPVGQRLEIVPLSDPSQSRSGDTLPVLVRFEAKPIAGLTVNAGWSGQPGNHAVTVVTDTAGRAMIPLGASGLWYVRTEHMRPAAEPGLDYESFWSSLTFVVSNRR